MSRVRGGKGTLVIENRVTGEKQEFNTLTCCHCNRIVVLNPKRVRPREWCRKCNQYVCDDTLCVVECNPIQQGVELALKYSQHPVYGGMDFLGRDKTGAILFDPRLKEREKVY